MAIEFECPNGHLLEVEDSLVGQECQCPACNIICIVPEIEAVDDDSQQVQPRSVVARGKRSRIHRRGRAPDADELPDFMPRAGKKDVSRFDPDGQKVDRILHLECRCGQLLQATRDLMGQDLVCPNCGREFTARYDHTLEAEQEYEEKEERKIRKSAKLWLNWAIVFAVLAVFGIILLFTSLR